MTRLIMNWRRRLVSPKDTSTDGHVNRCLQPGTLRSSGQPTPLRNGEKMRRMTHRVFVYGTLKSGLWNHYLLKGCEFFGGAAIHGYAGFAVDHVSLQEWII